MIKVTTGHIMDNIHNAKALYQIKVAFDIIRDMQIVNKETGLVMGSSGAGMFEAKVKVLDEHLRFSDSLFNEMRELMEIAED